MTVYNATLKLANETAFDFGIYTNVWMDNNYNWSNPDYLQRTRGLIDYNVNFLVDVLHTLTASIVPVDIISRYAGSDGIIQRGEAVQAVLDFFASRITRQDAVAVVLAFFSW